MSQTSSFHVDSTEAESTETDYPGDEDLQKVLEALADPACRRILREVSGTPLSAGELSERCELPQSTTYRKLDELVDAELVEERTRLGRNGNHSSEYAANVVGVDVEVGEDGSLNLDLSLANDEATPLRR